MDPHGAAEDFIGFLIVRALFLLGEVVADHGRVFCNDPLRSFLRETGGIVPPFWIGRVVALWPIGAKKQHTSGFDFDALLLELLLRFVQIARSDALVIIQIGRVWSVFILSGGVRAIRVSV